MQCYLTQRGAFHIKWHIVKFSIHHVGIKVIIINVSVTIVNFIIIETSNYKRDCKLVKYLLFLRQSMKIFCLTPWWNFVFFDIMDGE